MSGKTVMILGSTVRLAYGLAAMVAPHRVAGRLAAAETSSVMNLRGFGGQHIAIASFTLGAARSRELARPALFLNAGIEVCDALAGALEIRDSGVRDPVAVGGVVLPLA